MAIQETLPDRLGPYRLLDRIGEGGMGVVHLAADPENRLVAVKVLRPQIAGDRTARRRLAREVETMRRVRSPFVAEMIDADVTGPVPYVVTRYVRGRTLEQVVDACGPLRGPSLQRLAWGLARAIAAVHAAGVVHRDLKPSNVMMVGDDPVVIDFGIAQVGETTRLTQTGMFVGTPGYLAPEVIEGEQSSQSSDVHSWGSTVAFAATGKPPYGTGSYEVVFFRILYRSASLDGLPEALYPLVAAALTREPGRRPSAAWLAGQAARLDLKVPSAAWRAPATTGPVAGGQAPARQPEAVPFPGISRWRAGRVKGMTPRAATGHVQDGEAAAAYEVPGDVADLLPPVRYPPPQEMAPAQPRAGHEPVAQPRNVARPARAATPPRRRRMLALATLVMAVGTSVILPIAGTVLVIALIALLRAADRAQSGLALRRSARGPRATDALVVALSAPWTLARSVLVTVLVAPFALLLAGMAAVAAIIVMRGTQLPVIGAYVAGVVTAVNYLGPGSRAPRRQLNRAFNAISPTRLAAAAATIILGSFAAALVSLAMIKTPAYWPVRDPRSLLVHLPGAGLFHGSILRMRHVGHGVIRGVHVP